jgi:hypothetical protein
VAAVENGHWGYVDAKAGGLPAAAAAAAAAVDLDGVAALAKAADQAVAPRTVLADVVDRAGTDRPVRALHRPAEPVGHPPS